MKTVILGFKKEFSKDNLVAAITCLILSISIFFIMGVLNRPGVL
ncbi:hypothetical protein [Spongiimicrobium sp. 3-5]